jgi:hypothetical protein
VTLVGEMTSGGASENGGQRKRKIYSGVRRLVGYVVDRRREIQRTEWDLKSESGKYRYDLVFRQYHPVIKDQANTLLIPFGARGSLFH